MSRALAASALTVLLASCSAASAGTIPRVEKARIHAVLHPYDFFPASLPKGLIYIGFEQTSLSPAVCGRMVTIQFAGAGVGELYWSSSRACDRQGRVACTGTGYPGYGFGIGYTIRATINHRTVWFSPGNHGSNAWTCIPLRVGGFRDWAAVGIWESNFITPRQAMSLVAHARR